MKALHDEFHTDATHLDAILPTGVHATTVPRRTGASNQSMLVSGRESMVACYLRAGMRVSAIAFYSGSTALVTGANQWFTLRNASRALLAVTADDGATAWGALARKSLAFASTYQIPADGLYYLGLMVNASTVPSLLASLSSSVITGRAPILAGSDTTNTGLTTPATAPATSAALASSGTVPYAEVVA